MATKKKMLMSSAGAAGAGGEALNVEDVFSTYLHTGTGASKSIVNGVDLAGEGGLVWSKGRSSARANRLIDTERGVTKTLRSDATLSEETYTDTITSFNSDGFTLGADASSDSFNRSTNTYATWTFRKAPKFFDVVTYTGDGNSTKTISHNLGTNAGLIIVKRTDTTSNWVTTHFDEGGTGASDKRIFLLNTTDQNNASPTYNGGYIDLQTDSTFTVTEVSNNKDNVNVLNATYVAYLFAHNDGDGEFGPDGDADIIKCGSWTGSGSSGTQVELGFEPQWVMVKQISGSSESGWMIFDVMRDMNQETNTRLLANETSVEGSYTSGNVPIALNATGFKVKQSYFYDSGNAFIYIAIRRGTKAPESATEVFAIDNQTASSAPFLTSNFPVDMVIRKKTTGSNSEVMSRLTQGKALFANATSSEQTDSVAQFDFNDGCLDNTSTDSSRYGWMWKRAPGYFDAVAYTGDGVAGRTVSHNLGVAPEMMWVKCRDTTLDWAVYTATTGNNQILKLNTSGAALSPYNWWNYTTPTDSVFTLGGGTNVNGSGKTYISYFFSSLDGISKVGSFTATGSTLNVDCGFTSGARFVLIKRTDSTGDWFVFDSVRGITASTSPYLYLNSTSSESVANYVNPHSSGFTITSDFFGSGNFIFYAIA